MEGENYILRVEESNIAFLGSEMEKKQRYDIALTEEAWKGVGEEPGVKIWRIEKFNVKPWPINKYGSFYMGDTYIIIFTYKDERESLQHNLHMWVGLETSKDEAGTAAYKIVELDTLLNSVPTLYREVQGNESSSFLSYFDTIKILSGGIESGFTHVKPEEYKPRLLNVRRIKDKLKINEMPLSFKSLNSGDSFILDAGLKIFSWYGKESNSFEKFKTASLCKTLSEKRKNTPEVINLLEGEETEEFWAILNGKGEIQPANVINDSSFNQNNASMFKLSDITGQLVLTRIEFNINTMDSSDVYFIDMQTHLIVWIGSKSSSNEKGQFMKYATQYLKDFNRPSTLPFCCVKEGVKIQDMIS